MPLPQTLYTWPFGYGAELSFIDVTRNAEGRVENTNACQRDKNTAVATYTIEGNTITLNGTTDTHLLAAVYDDNDDWLGSADFNSVYTEAQFEQLVTSPGEGDEYYYVGRYNNGTSNTKLDATVRVYRDGNDIYFKGIASGNAGTDADLLPDAWVKGTISGNKVTIPSGQFLGVARSNRTYLIGRDVNGIADVTLTYDEATQTYTFDNYYYLSTKPNMIHYLLMFEPRNTICVEKPLEPEVVTPPVGLHTEVYTFSANILTYVPDPVNGGQVPNYTPVKFFVNVGFDGSDVYIQGLSRDDLPQAWVKGTRNGNKITLPTGQYFGTYSYTVWGGAVIDDEHYMVGMYIDPEAMGYYIKDVVLDYDSDRATMTTQDYLLDNGTKDTMNPFYIYTNIVIELLVEHAATPQNPMIIDYQDFGSFGRMMCNIPTVDTEERIMNLEKLYYVIYAEIDGQPTPLTFTTDVYNIPQEMLEIPYGFTEDYDIFPGAAPIYLNQPEYANFTNVGIQVIYYGQDRTPAPQRAPYTGVHGQGNASDIVWWYERTAVDNVGIANTVIAEQYTNLAGQTSSRPFSGVNIVTRTHSDGTTTVAKMMK